MTKQSRRPGSQKEDENREQGTGNRRWRLLLFLFLFPIPYSLVPAFAQTPVQVLDTLYNADGTKASGRIVLSWDPFTPAGGGATVDGGNKTYTIPATGASAGVVNVSLYSNVGATPSGTNYRARYFLANGANYTETWVVPATGPVTIAAVRVSVVPSPTITFNPTTQLYNSAGAQGDLLVGSATTGYFSRLTIGSNGLCLTSNGTTAAWASCATGSGITSLNGQFGTTQTFSRVNDTNVTLTISSAANDHGFTMGWAGALGLARGGTNQTSWTAARCVRVNNTGTSLESAAADCGAGGGGGGHTIQEEGSNLPQQGSLNFVGAALTAADDAANSRTNVTLSQSPASASVVGTGRAINTTSPLSGGGDLTADRTLSCPTCEVTGNKNAASGYAGLTASTKLNAPQGQEVWALADLSDAAITTPATAQTVRYNGSAWVNAALGFADLSGAATDGQVDDNITLTNLTQITNRAISDTTGTLAFNRGGTNQTAWTASRCVQVNSGGTALESAAAACGGGGGAPGGSDTQVQFNDGGAFGGDADFAWNKTTNILTNAGRYRVGETAGDVATPADGDLWYNSNQEAHRFQATVGALGLSGLYFAQTSVQAGDTVSNTTSETNFATTAAAFPANSLTAGKVIRITAHGTSINNSGSSATYTLRAKFGSTVLCLNNSPSGISHTTSANTYGWTLSCDVTVITTGAGGTVEANGDVRWRGVAVQSINTAAISVNTTATQAPTISVTMTFAHASTSATMRQLIVEVLN